LLIKPKFEIVIALQVVLLFTLLCVQIVTTPVVKPTKCFELLNRITGQGLAAEYKFTRRAHVYSPKMVAVEVTFANKSDGTLSGISVGSKRLQKGMAIKDIPHLTQLAPGGSISVTMGIDFNDTLQPAKFDLW